MKNDEENKLRALIGLSGCKVTSEGVMLHAANEILYLRQQREQRVKVAEDLRAALEMIQAAFIHKPGDVKGNKARTAPLKYCNKEFSAALNAARVALDKYKRGK